MCLAPLHKAVVGFMVMLLVGLGTVWAAEQATTFHGIRLGVSLGSQFQECLWDPKEGEFPKYISTLSRDQNGNAIPCFLHWLSFTPAPFPRVERVELVESFGVWKDSTRRPLLGLPVVYIKVLVPAATQLDDGTIEQVMLIYMPQEADRVKDALVKKFGASHAPENKLNTKKIEELWGAKIISREAWKTDWGELFLRVTDNDVTVVAKTSKLIGFERQNKKDEF
jgi:hypothetical protein